MVCSSKWCGWIQSVAQILVAGCFLYMAYVANMVLVGIEKELSEAGEDMHQIRISMENMELSMVDMNNELHVVNKSVSNINTNMQHMNMQVGGVRRKLNPMRMFSPF